MLDQKLHTGERADSVQNTIEYSGNDDEEASEFVNTHKINYHKMLDQSLKQRTSIEKVASNGQNKNRQNR